MNDFDWKQITGAEFAEYKKVQYSGLTNMIDMKTVSGLSGLPIEKIHAIMWNYGELSEKYPEKRGRKRH